MFYRPFHFVRDAQALKIRLFPSNSRPVLSAVRLRRRVDAPDAPGKRVGRGEKLIAWSRERFGAPRPQVETQLVEWTRSSAERSLVNFPGTL